MNNLMPSPRTALVVEDHRVLLDVLHDVLEDAGFDTTAVDHGRQTMTMLAERCFDVLVVDVNLLDVNGMAISELARERYQTKS